MLRRLKRKMFLIRSKSGVARVVIALIVIIVVGGVAAGYMAFKPGSSHLSAAPTPSPSAAPTSSPLSSPKPTPSPSPKPTPTQVPRASPTPTPIPTPTSSPKPTPSPTPSSTPNPSPTPSPAPTPTPAPVYYKHTVEYTTMMTGDEVDYWNQSVSAAYTVTLTDSMTVSSGAQQLGVWAYNSANTKTQQWIWNVNFMNSTFAYYWVNTGGGTGPQGHISCINGLVYVVVTNTSVEFIGSSTPVTVPTTFQDLGQIQTQNGGGVFNGGKLSIEIEVPAT